MRFALSLGLGPDALYAGRCLARPAPLSRASTAHRRGAGLARGRLLRPDPVSVQSLRAALPDASRRARPESPAARPRHGVSSAVALSRLRRLLGAVRVRADGAHHRWRSELWTGLVRRWALIAWGFLTTGILLGGWWAYYELGWGGYWAWDPVENASFMPWLLGTALLHSIAVQDRRQMLHAWNIFLVISTFSLSLLGTFLVRSGVLSSVHAFAVDPAAAPTSLRSWSSCSRCRSAFSWRAGAISRPRRPSPRGCRARRCSSGITCCSPSPARW